MGLTMNNTHPIKEQIAEKTRRFCQSYLDKEYEDLCHKVIEKLSRKRSASLARGKLEIWAAAIIHSVGSINFLFDKSIKPHVTYDQLSEYYGVPKSTINQKSRKIRELLKMSYWSTNFSTQRMLVQNPF